MAGFEPWTSGVGSNHLSNWATTSALCYNGFLSCKPYITTFCIFKTTYFFESYPIHYSPLNYHDLGFSRKLIHTNSLSLSLSWSMLQSNFFGGNRDFSKIKKLKNSFFALMYEPAKNMKKNAILIETKL